MKNIHLGIVEDEPFLMESLQTYLGEQPEIRIDLTAYNMEDFLKAMPSIPSLNAVLLDISLPGMSGLEGIPKIKSLRPDLNITILSSRDDSNSVFKALCAGAVSYISKTQRLPTIKDALITVHSGGSHMSPSIARKVIEYFSPQEQDEDKSLTPRQEQIVQGLVDGLSYKMIADRYQITLETVRDHIKKIYKKLEVNSKAEVISKKLRGEI